MTNCIKCGKPIEDGELFCSACDLNPEAAARTNAAIPERSGRMQTPVKNPPVKPRAPEGKKSEAEKIRKTGKTVWLAWGLAVIGLTLAIWQYAGMARQRRAVRLREEAVAAQEAEQQTLRQELEALGAELEAAQQTQTELNAQLEQLRTAASSAENSANQSQYDLTEQQKALQEALEENAALLEQIGALEEDVKTLEQETAALQEQYDAQSGQVRFVDSYVVFVEDDGTGCYHKYGCSRFLKKNFWAYSRKLAEKQGYTPCGQCFGG